MRRFILILVLSLLVPIVVEAGDTAVFESYKYKNITTATNTVIKAAAGIIGGFVVNSGTMGTITLYDNTTCSTTKIATITAPTSGGIWPAGAKFTTGLCITTGAATDMTVFYQ